MLALLVVALMQAATLPVSAEAVPLGVRLAQISGIAVMAPMLIEKDLTELAREDGSLTDAEQRRLIEIGRAQGRAGLDKLAQALGREYAQRLSMEDLRQLVSQSESSAAVRWRAVAPIVIMEAMKELGSIDLKKGIASAFCRETGKLCDRK